MKLVGADDVFFFVFIQLYMLNCILNSIKLRYKRTKKSYYQGYQTLGLTHKPLRVKSPLKGHKLTRE